jgi:ABC-type antimicrobial peptide transport system permease subunit
LLFVRADPAAGTLEDALHESVTAVDPAVTMFDVATMEQRLAAGLGDERFVTVTLSVYAAAALILATLGVHAMVRVSVARRTREIGIRVAIGATRGRITCEVVSTVALPAVAGTAAGVVGAWWFGQVLTSLLHGLAPRDPATVGAAAAVLLVSATGAALGPALRAGRIDPILALRVDV